MKRLEEMSFEEKVLRSIIIDLRNYVVGGYENACLDNGEEDFIKTYGYITKEQVVEEIYNEIMCGNDKYIQSPTRMLALEKKHIKFMGSKFVRELIEDRVEKDYYKNDWMFPNNYEG